MIEVDAGKVKIVSDGTSVGTTVYDGNGEVMMVKKCTIVIDVDKPLAKVSLEVYKPEMLVTTNVENVKVKRIPIYVLGGESPLCFASEEKGLLVEEP